MRFLQSRQRCLTGPRVRVLCAQGCAHARHSLQQSAGASAVALLRLEQGEEVGGGKGVVVRWAKRAAAASERLLEEGRGAGQVALSLQSARVACQWVRISVDKAAAREGLHVKGCRCL